MRAPALAILVLGCGPGTAPPQTFNVPADVKGGAAATPSASAYVAASAAVVTPPPPPAIPRQISADSEVTCATMSDGTVWCWGDNQFGQVGEGADERQTKPHKIPNLTGVAKVSVGEAHVCVLMQDATVRCWGSNYYGALGLGDEAARTEPTVVPGLTDITQVATGWASCALSKDGTVTCWGDWDPGVGDPRSIGAKSPVKVLGVKDAVEIGVGRSHSCARNASGQVTCWRHISPGLVPRGKVRADPVLVRINDATGISLSSYGAAVTKSGQVKCWAGCAFDGTNLGAIDYSASALVPKISHAVEVVTSDDVACVRKDDGTVDCQTKSGLATMSQISKATQLARGDSHICALLEGATVMCWGDNSAGQLGNGTKVNSTTPVRVRFE